MPPFCGLAFVTFARPETQQQFLLDWGRAGTQSQPAQLPSSEKSASERPPKTWPCKNCARICADGECLRLIAGSRGQQPTGQADEEAAALRTSKWAVSRAPDHDDLIWETLHVGRFDQHRAHFFPSHHSGSCGYRVVV